MLKHINKLFLTLAVIFSSTLGYAQVVSNESQLNAAIDAAGPGTTITLANGVWNDVFIDIHDSGTAAAPITIQGETPGAVLMTGNSHVYMKGDYIFVSGLVFQDPANLANGTSKIDPVFRLDRCHNCKVLNNKIDSYNGTEAEKELTFKWILTDGQNNEIAYNSFVGKYGIGSIINDNRNTSEPDYLKIHHNYFANRTPINEVNDDNDQDAIRIGNSATSLDNSFTEVYDNYFHNFFGEVEMISNKSGNNKYYNNTFRNYAGTLTLRHGDNCEVYGNYFFAEQNTFSGGVRVIGEGHKVYNNYIEGVNSQKASGSLSNAVGGINVSNGRENTEINGYYQVKDVTIVNNTFVDCDYALRIGTQVKSDLFQEPENLIVANNIMYDISENPYQIVTTPSGNSVSSTNLADLANGDMEDDGNLHRLTSGSTPINAANATYTCSTLDILGGARSTLDAGAEEFGAGGTRLPFVMADVGSLIGFGASSTPESSTLAAAPSMLNFDVCGSTTTFEVVSNVDWTITENLPWLSLDVTAGSGPKTITATAIQNTTGVSRTGTLILNDSGADDSSVIISAVQSNTSISSELPIVATTSVGMQQGNPVIAEPNAYDDDLTTYWTGNPDTDPEVSITFDLGNSFALTEIGINFWKADERTTTFSIAVADNAVGPFTTVIDNETSVSQWITVETEQAFSLDNSVGRFVKFIGIGNSSSTNWTSIANVNIYGESPCASSCTDGIMNGDETGIDCGGGSCDPCPCTETVTTTIAEETCSIYTFIEESQKDLFWTVNNEFIGNGSVIDWEASAPGMYEICGGFESPSCPQGVSDCKTIVVEADCFVVADCTISTTIFEETCSFYTLIEESQKEIFWTVDNQFIGTGSQIDWEAEAPGSYIICGVDQTNPLCPEGDTECRTIVVGADCFTACDIDTEFAIVGCNSFTFFEMGEKNLTWSVDGTMMDTGDEFNFEATAAGIYQVCGLHSTQACPQGDVECTTIAVSEGCFVTTDVDETLNDKISIYPTLTEGEFNIIGLSTEHNVSVLNANGMRCQTLENNGVTEAFDISNLPNGIYMITITNDKNQIVRIEKMLKM